MKKKIALVAAALAIAWGLPVVHASDLTGLYALVDKVTLEPSGDRPERIQIWGVFVTPVPNDRNGYQPPMRGYLYFQLPDAGADLARREWADLRQIAGKRQIVGLGSRYALTARVRPATEPLAAPDPYIVAAGLYRLRSETDYAPIKSLLQYRDR
jgi:hypothetical protein